MKRLQMTRRAAGRLALAALMLTWGLALHAAGLYTDPQAWAQATTPKPAPGKKAAKPDPAYAFVKSDPKLPNVLIIGDSISIGYTPGVREALAGKANVYRIKENGGDSARGLKQLDAWLNGMKWAAIHFNFGLHDLKYLDPQGKYDVKNGKQVASVEQYEKNLRELVKRLQATGAKLIFATTTPVPEASAGRVAGDEAKYNEAAKKVMQESGVAVDDLCALVQPKLAEYQLPNNVHFTPAGYAALANQVAGEIAKALNLGPIKTVTAKPEAKGKTKAKAKKTKAKAKAE